MDSTEFLMTNMNNLLRFIYEQEKRIIELEKVCIHKMVLSNKNKFNIKNGFNRDASHSLKDISKISGVSMAILGEVYKRGVGARKTNPQSVRSATTGKKVGGSSLKGKMSAEQWAFARVYGFVMGNPKQIGPGKPDNDQWKRLSPATKRKLKKD